MWQMIDKSDNLSSVLEISVKFTHLAHHLSQLGNCNVCLSSSYPFRLRNRYKSTGTGKDTDIGTGTGTCTGKGTGTATGTGTGTGIGISKGIVSARVHVCGPP